MMIRPWPQKWENDVIVNRLNSVNIPIIFGVISILLALLIAGLVIAHVIGFLPEKIGLAGIILFLGTMLIGGFISSIKKNKHPVISFLANYEGLYMNITFKMKNAFFVSWNDIERIEKIRIKRTVGRTGTREENACSVLLKTSSNCRLPKIMRGVVNCTNSRINFQEDTLDGNLDEVITKINRLKSKYSDREKRRTRRYD